MDNFEQTVRDVLGAYSCARDGHLIALGNRGGFSGARLWRVQTPLATFCARAWPVYVTSAHLDFVHHWMSVANTSGLPFVPQVMPVERQRTCLALAGRFWDLTTWLPGCADFRVRPERARLEAACTALAQVHAAWTCANLSPRVCPAILRRLQAVCLWQQRVQSGWRPHFQAHAFDPVAPWAERAWQLVNHCVDDIPPRLAAWSEVVVPVQPCLCDIWHDHVLFEDDRVTGLIDYGSMKIDHVAVDLARLLGSLAGNDRELIDFGLAAYSRLRSLSDAERRLVDVLDWTGTILGAANWLRWLYDDGRQFEDRELVASRLKDLVLRMENQSPLAA